MSMSVLAVRVVLISLSLCMSLPQATAAGRSRPPRDLSKASTNAADSAEQAADDSSATKVKEPIVVAKIGEFVITRDELIQRCMTEVRPQYEDYARPQEPVTPETVLLSMVAEKAMMMEGRKLGYLNDPIIAPQIERHRRQKLGTALVMDYIRDNPPTVEDADVDQILKANPKLSREQAKMYAYRSKANAVLGQLYKQLVEKLHVKLNRENFAKAARIHERLLRKPAKPRREGWILNSQIREELSEEEKGIILATYDGGEVTAQDLFETLGEIAPPGRPSNLSTPQGVEQFLDRPLRVEILVAEAKARGYDRNPQYLREMKELEDQRLLYKVQEQKSKDVQEPNEQQIKEFFEKHKEWFAENASLKVDQIWCENLAAARKAKQRLDDGEDFQAVKAALSTEKDLKPYNVYRNSEGPFWDKLWEGEPNHVVGPLKGFYQDGIAWRVVKILEKTPAKLKPWSEEIASSVKWAIVAERRKAALDSCGKELREKYGYELYADRIKDIDPLAVSPSGQTR